MDILPNNQNRLTDLLIKEVEAANEAEGVYFNQDDQDELIELMYEYSILYQCLNENTL